MPKLDVRKPGHYLYETTDLLTNVVPPGDDEPGVPMFTFGNTGRSSFRAPGISNFDLSFLKRFPLGEERWLEFRAELFTPSTTRNTSSPIPTQPAARMIKQRRPAIHG